MTLQSFVAKPLHRVHLPDDTLLLALDGPAFIGNRCRELGSDVFETRVMLQRTVCMLGAEAAQLFYSDKLQREAGAPKVALLGPLDVVRLVDKTHAEWRAYDWPARVSLLEVAQDVLAKAACRWAGLTIDDTRRARELTSTKRVARARAEWWLMRQLQAVRAHKLEAHGAMRVLADSDLDARSAAIELLDVLRPVVAVARHIAFAALALHEYPHAAELVASDALVEPFVHEVRRFFPLFPPATARARDAFEWHGVHFAPGERVMLDVYGTNHDARIWGDPEHFRPERFVGRAHDAFPLLPPPEPVATELMKSAVKLLTRELTYDVPDDDVSVSLAVENVQRR